MINGSARIDYFNFGIDEDFPFASAKAKPRELFVILHIVVLMENSNSIYTWTTRPRETNTQALRRSYQDV